MPIGSQEKRQTAFLRIEEFSRHHPGKVFLATAVLVFVAIWLGSRVRLDTDILALVPQGDRAVDAFKASLVDFGSADFIGIMVEAPEGHTADEYQDFVDLFAEKISLVDGVRQVEYRLGGSTELLALFRKYALLFLPTERLPDLAEKLSDASIARQVADDRRLLESPGSTFTEEIVLSDPLGLGPLLWGHLLKGQGVFRINPVDGYFLSQDGTAMLLLVKPGQPAQNLGFTRRLVEEVKAAEAAALSEIGESGAPDGLSEVTIEYAGTYIVALDDSELIKSDMKVTAVLSFVGVLGLYLIGYRRFGALIYSSAPLIVGQALTFAVAFLVLGRLNSASSGFVAMVMGLGTDFTIVMYARYVEERLSGLSLADASRRMMGEGALGMFTGAITSAGTFYAMCVTEFRGLWELGFLIGTGILLSMIAILFLLPAMIQWNESRPRRVDVTRKLYIQSFGFERLIPIAARHRAATLLLLGFITAGAGVAAWNIGFSEGISDLRSPNNKGLLAQEKMREKFGGDLNFMMAIVDDTAADGVVERVREVVAAAEPFVAEGILRGTDSIVDYLPAPSRQRQVIDALRAGRDGEFDPDRVEATFRRALVSEGFHEDAFDAYLDEFRALLSRTEPIGISDLQDHDLGAVLDRYLVESGGGYRAAVYLFLEEGRWRSDAPPGLVEALQGGDPRITVTGVNVVSARLRSIFARDAKLAIGLGLLLVSFLLWLDFRSMKLMLLANLQVLGGVVWMLGVMSLADVQLNFVNCFVATMILGVGVDYGIHLIHRMRFNGGVVDAGVIETGKAVAMASMTNIVGFGSLAMSNYPGLRSVGIISVVGSIACLVTALTLLPAVLSIPGFAAPKGDA